MLNCIKLYSCRVKSSSNASWNKHSTYMYVRLLYLYIKIKQQISNFSSTASKVFKEFSNFASFQEKSKFAM